MKLFKKLLIAVCITMAALIIVPNIVPEFESAMSVQAASVKISKSNKKLNVKESFKLKITGTNKKVKWSTSNKKVATVNSKGKVTAKKAGTATITAKVGGKKYTCKVKVENPKISLSYLTIQKGKDFKLKVKGTSQKVTWSSSNKKIAKVNSKGVVKAVNEGTATITAKVGKTKYTCRVHVIKANYAEKIKLSYTKLGSKALIKIENNNPCRVDYLSVDVNFYKNGKLLDTRFFNAVCLGKGSTAYDTVYAPMDSNYNYVDFDNIKFNISSANVYSNNIGYTNLKKYVKITHSKNTTSGTGVIGSIHNNGTEKMSGVQFTVLYYKNNKLVQASQHYEHDIEAGASKSFKISAYDNNYRALDFDSYKIHIDTAYAY